MGAIDERKFWMSFRQALLMMVDAVEQAQGIEPRTSRLRKAVKDEKRLEVRRQRADMGDKQRAGAESGSDG
jgi:hypothetical protein